MNAKITNEKKAAMNRRTPKVDRRTVLRGVGVAMALPWLESIPAWGQEPANAAASLPKRFAVLFMGNGINPNHWWAKGSAASMELSQSLEPMAPFKAKMNVINGLFNKHATGVGIHPGQTGNILSGAALQKGAVLKGGVSVDQMLARHLGDETAEPSLVLGCEQPITGYHETNFSMAYSSHISWQDAMSPVPMEVYPSLAFDSLFDNHGSRRTLSILDRVREQTAALNRQVSHADRIHASRGGRGNLKGITVSQHHEPPPELAMNPATTTATATPGLILALDLGKYKTVACAYAGDPSTARFETLTTDREHLRKLFA